MIDRQETERQRVLKAGDPERLADFIEGNLAFDRKFNDDVAALDPPSQDRDALGRYLEANRRTVLLTQREIAALRRDDVSGYRALGQTGQRFSEQRITAAIDLGADDCGQP